MRVPVDFIFRPTPALLDAARRWDGEALAGVAVWRTHDFHGRLMHAQEELEAAFWSVFQAMLVHDRPTADQAAFRQACLDLGFTGCWSVERAREGGEAQDLVEEAKRAANFLRDHGP